MKSLNMSRTLDDLGRINIPKTLRDKCGFEKGMTIEYFTTIVDGKEYLCIPCPRTAEVEVTEEK